MKNSSQTQHHRSETEMKEEEKIEEIRKIEDAGCRLEVGTIGTVAGTVPKFATDDNFAMIAKFRYHSKKYCA